MIIDGKKIARETIARLATLPRPEKFLAGVLVGGDPVLMSFLKIKQKTADQLGIDSRIFEFPETIAEDALCANIAKIAEDPQCGGIVLELPLPVHLDVHHVVDSIPSEKDPDVLSVSALQSFQSGKNTAAPLSVATVEAVLGEAEFSVASRTVAVVGAGFLIGQPVAAWLQGNAGEVLVLDKGDDFSLLKKADLVICGAGVPGLVNPEMLKDGAGVIDFGYSVIDGKSKGDFDASGEGIENVSFYTPTPGGTGPILVAKLFENFYKLNQAN